MSWKKFYKVTSPIKHNQSGNASNISASVSKFSNWLPEVYQGPPNRLQRYVQYEQMNLDHEINAALDTLAEFSTQLDDRTGIPFEVRWKKDPSSSETMVLEKVLKQWCYINEFPKRMFRIFRSTMVYGDQFFIRDPQTYKLLWVDPSNVEKILVNESKGKEPEIYYITGMDLNLQSLTASNMMGKSASGYSSADSVFPNAPLSSQANFGSATANPAISGQGSYTQGNESFPVDAKHVVQISLTEGMDSAWPFGISILEPVFKIYKQKELLEDSVLIYRIHRAPERRVFKIDVGTMPPNKAHQYIERVKYEVQQKRIPSRTGGGQSITDSAYNPMCLDLSTRIPLLDGRTLELNDLITEYKNGKENWVYSTDPITGKIMPGNITWAGVTRKNAETIKITLDNNKEIICTPDHKIPVLGKGFVEAKDLTSADPLISFETREKSLSNDPKRSYTQIFDHETNTWKYVHRVVAEFFKDMEKHQIMIFDEELNEEKTTVHHKDYDRYNNDPRNLVWMGFEDHKRFHIINKKEYWENITPEEAERVKSKIRKSLQEYRTAHPNWKEDQYKNHSQKIKDALAIIDDEVRQEQYIKCGKARAKYLKNNPEAKEHFAIQGTKILREKRAKNQTINFTQDMLTRVVECVKENDSNRTETINLLNNDKMFIDMMKEANPIDPKSTHNVKNSVFTASKLNKMYVEYGYSGWKDFKQKTAVYNHRIVSIEHNDSRDVGTITVDFQERWHSHHTFALEAGIFVKNSMLEDYYFAQTCLSLDTAIPLLDGRTMSIAELIEEYKNGKENYVYSQNRETHELEPGKIVWADITRKSAKVVRVHLDNGKYIDATPDHRFIMRDGNEVEAQHLNKNDSLMPLYLNNAKTSPKQKGKPYLRYISNADGKTKWVHTAICPKENTGKDYEIHHIDFDSRNNNPSNLVEMATHEHRQLHKDAGTYSIGKQWQDTAAREKLLRGIRDYHANISDNKKEEMVIRNKSNGAKVWERKESANKVLSALSETRSRVSRQKTIKYSDDMFKRMVQLFNEGHTSVIKMTKVLRDDCKFQELFVDANHNILRDNSDIQIKPTDTTLNKLVATAGYNSWGDFKENYNYNHKVQSVEWLSETMDTADITVETPSNSHIFLTDAGVFVHNSDGRGSSVETLPGGDNMGEIDDLRYFNNKMMRALGVPSSYLPTGPEDGSASYNDGRVGTAFIQEFRFSKTCQRHQNKIVEMFDTEFKYYLKAKGYEGLDTSMFEIKFLEPQNFSKYRQIELDSAQLSNFSSVADIPFISKRFALKKYLGLSEEEIKENERMITEETKGAGAASQGIDGIGVPIDTREVGVSPEGGEDFEETQAGDGDLGDEDMGDSEPEIGADDIDLGGDIEI